MKKSIYQDIYLLYPLSTFPGGEWIHFLTTFGRDSRRKKRRTDDYLIWDSVPGRGFIVWVSEARPWNYNGEYKWRIIVSLAGDNVHGIILQHLIPYLAIQRWGVFEILIPGNLDLFKAASEFLIFARQAILNRASLEELSKYGYLDEHGEVQIASLM